MSSSHSLKATGVGTDEASRSQSSSDTALEQVPEKEEVKGKADVHDTDTVPNGGLKAWLQAAGSFFLMFNTW